MKPTSTPRGSCQHGPWSPRDPSERNAGSAYLHDAIRVRDVLKALPRYVKERERERDNEGGRRVLGLFQLVDNME